MLPWIAAASDELPQQGGAGHVVGWNRQEIAEEFQQPLGLDVLLAVLGHGKEQRLHIGLQQGSLIEQGGVEDHIRAVLVGEDVSLLPTADGGPQLDGGPGVIAPGAGVPLDPAEQAGVCGGDAVVVVHIQC